jgi:hypothetical protein
MENSENLELKIIDEVGQEKLSELTLDYAELSLDFFMENDVLKDIPLFGTFFKFFKTATNIKDQIFLKKLYSFLFHLKDIPLNKRVEFINNLEDSKQKVGEKLLILIEKLDDLDKPKMISNLFRAVIEEKISYEEFLIISNAVANSYINDLKKLKSKNISYDIQERLSHNGIFAVSLTTRRDLNIVDEINERPVGKQIKFQIQAKSSSSNFRESIRERNQEISISIFFIRTLIGDKIIEHCFE